jgi:hypothetical protein
MTSGRDRQRRADGGTGLEVEIDVARAGAVRNIEDDLIDTQPAASPIDDTLAARGPTFNTRNGWLRSYSVAGTRKSRVPERAGLAGAGKATGLGG